MINVNINVLELLEKLLAKAKSKFVAPPKCHGPRIIRFTAYVGEDKSGKFDVHASDRYGSCDVVGCYGLYVQGKDALDDDWFTIDEILDVIKWIADGWYVGKRKLVVLTIGEDTPREPKGTYMLEKRSNRFLGDESRPFSSMPRLIKLSTPNTYSSSDPTAYIPIKIETRTDEDTKWNTSPGGPDYWHSVLTWFQRGMYRLKDRPSHISCVYERI